MQFFFFFWLAWISIIISKAIMASNPESLQRGPQQVISENSENSIIWNYDIQYEKWVS